MGTKPLWRCPKYGRPFVNRDQWHSCVAFTVEDHLRAAQPFVVALYRQLLARARRCGPIVVMPTKSRIGFQVRMIFADVYLRSRWIELDLILARRAEGKRFLKVETFSPRNHLHRLRIRRTGDLDAELQGRLCEAYAVGAQEHLKRRG